MSILTLFWTSSTKYKIFAYKICAYKVKKLNGLKFKYKGL